MAFIGLRVPSETGRLLESVEAPGVKKAASEMHVTILYLGKNLPIETVAQSMIATFNVASQTNPFICGVKEVSSFPPNPDDGIPVIFPVLSPSLHTFRDALKNEFTRLKVPYSDKYPDYKPHVSLSFIKDSSMTSYNAPMKGPLTWTASEVVIWGGNKNDELVSVVIPFVLGPLERVARRMLEVRP